MHYLIFVSIIISISLSAEPSVYDSSSSYTNEYQDSIITLQQEISQLRQEVDGLRSVLEGLSLTINDIKQNAANSGDINNINNKDLHDLEVIIDKINSSYVSKNEFEEALKSGRLTKSAIGTKNLKTSKKTTTSRNDKLRKKLRAAKSKDLYSKGVRLVKQKKYSLAKLRFDILKKRGYKKASTHFYLGEIAYKTKNYSDAIDHYKISTQANENANYMSKLLLHTGISLQKTGQTDRANKFFQAIIDGYPNSYSAKIAKKKIQ